MSIIFGHGLQRLFYGPLRAMEVEQIYEKAWYAVTETCLAMTIFRDEFDVRFIIMFGVLLFVKCFSWIGGGRVEFVCLILQSCVLLVKFCRIADRERFTDGTAASKPPTVIPHSVGEQFDTIVCFLCGYGLACYYSRLGERKTQHDGMFTD